MSDFENFVQNYPLMMLNRDVIRRLSQQLKDGETVPDHKTVCEALLATRLVDKVNVSRKAKAYHKIFEMGLHKMNLVEFRNYTDTHDSYNLHSMLGIYESKLRKNVNINDKRVRRCLMVIYDEIEMEYQILDARSEEIRRV